MTTLLIVIVSLFAYIVSAVYLHLRLLWYFKRANVFDPSIPAFFCAAILPVGIALLVVYAITGEGVVKGGLPPRRVRRERKIKAQEVEIARLERELELYE